MTHYRAQPEDDAVLIVLCAVRDGQFGKSALNEVIDLWVAGQIGRTDSTQGAVSANDDAFQVICDALSALQPPQARELMETPSYKAFAAFYKRGQ